MSANIRSRRERIVCNNGSVFAECAVSAAFFAFFLIGSLDTVRVIQIKDSLQNGVNRAGRYSVLGSRLPEDPDPNNPVQSVRLKIEQLSSLQLSDFKICKANGTGTCATSNSRGEPKDWIYIKAQTRIPLLLNSIHLTVSADTLVRNQEKFGFVTVPPSTAQSVSIFDTLSY